MRRAGGAVPRLINQLEALNGLVALVQLPGVGRGLIANRDIPQGAMIHREVPMLAHPSVAAAGAADCSTCLRPLGAAAPEPRSATGGTHFCSDQCAHTAQHEWLRVQQRADFSGLQAASAVSGEKFPLLAARLACTRLQKAEDQCSGAAREVPDAGAALALRGDPLQARSRSSSGGLISSCDTKHPLTSSSSCPPARPQDLDHLCFANLPHDPPREWRSAHAVLLRSLRPTGLSLGGLTLEWYCGVLSRLHLNVFRVDTVPALDLRAGPAALLRAASGAVAGGHLASGSAVYLLGSMFNHSCEPNVDVTFPRNDATVAFVAATDIPRHEQLCISYVDTGLGVLARRRQLEFGYGFECGCQRCRDES